MASTGFGIIMSVGFFMCLGFCYLIFSPMVKTLIAGYGQMVGLTDPVYNLFNTAWTYVPLFALIGFIVLSIVNMQKESDD